MKVFLSWSGDRSHKIAILLNWWLKCVIQAIDPWLSSKDIEKGALWFADISTQLSSISVGIVCLTQENKNKPWILFEAGALAKGISSARVCPILIDLKSTDVEPPLSQFNLTYPDKDGMKNLVRSINQSLAPSILNDDILDKAFDTYWNQFESEFKTILDETPDTTTQKGRPKEDILMEVLSSIRNIDKRIRYLENQPINFYNNDKYVNLNNNIAIKNIMDKAFTVMKPTLKQLIAEGAPLDIIFKYVSEKLPHIPNQLIKERIDKEIMELEFKKI